MLATLVVIAQSFPRPNPEYKLPDVPAGKRAQYYVLHNNGDYKYGFDTGAGAYEKAVKMGPGDLTGFFGFNNALGQNVRVDYTAGVDGYKPTISETAGAPTTYSHQQTSPPRATFKSNPEPNRPFEAADIESTHNLDGSYSFAYENSDSSRRESADPANNVVGKFSFVADGENHEVNYKAGSGTGFVAAGAHLPENVDSSAAAVFGSSGAVSDSGAASAVEYSAPSVESHASGAAHASISQSEPRGDASYSFSYKTGDSTRSEVSDSDLNVKGDYSFVADDGVERRVEYVAGSGTGFVATGAHLPENVDSSATAVFGSSGAVSDSGAASAVEYSAPSVESHASGAAHASISQSEPRGDASYSFSYKTGDSTRSEVSDSDLNVKGDYSFVADDGVERRVEYVAGSGTGFVATGAHLPENVDSSATAVFGSSGAVSDSGAASAVEYSAPSVESHASGAAHASISQSEPRGDASYSFSYKTGDSTRSEVSDSDLNVKGDYSFVADDGVERRVEYVAGSGTGFVATGAHLPENVDSSATAVFGSSGVVSDSGAASAVEYSSPSVESHASGAAHASISQSEPRGDASYSFSYKTGDSARSEVSDSDLNVKGDYSFVADDGVERRVEYVAGSGTGFVATGAHLPENVDSSATAVFGSSGAVSDSGAASAVEYSAPSVESDASGADHASISQSEPRGDASYSFSYQTGDSDRSEVSDSDLNVKGEYSFVADDGVRRRVNYVAGSETGFVATGAHLPAVDESTAPVGQISGFTTGQGSAIQYSGPSVITERSNVASGPIFYRSPSNDASYSFSYQTEDSSRNEAADGDLNIKGQYSFVADDGVERRIQYIAGSDTGFIATGDHIPTTGDTQESSASAVPYSGSSTIAVEQPGFAAFRTGFSKPDTSATSAGAHPISEKSFRDAIIENSQSADGSYQFSYINEDSARRESADNENNVDGEYSFVVDGQSHHIKYRAGSGIGYVPEGDSIPSVPSIATPITATQYKATSTGDDESDASISQTHSDDSRRDASYSFNYETQDSTRNEKADSDLNTEGEYSFVADDGEKYTVHYIAGSDTGFVASGAHLPTPVVNEDSIVAGQASDASHATFKAGSWLPSNHGVVAAGATFRNAKIASSVSGDQTSTQAKIITDKWTGPVKYGHGYVFTEV